MAQKIMPVVGLEKLYVAKITKDDNTGAEYDIPKYLAGVKEIGINPKANTENFYAENKVWDSETTLEDIEVTVNITDLTDEDEALLLGHKLATEGGIIRSEDDIAPEVALLFKANKSKGATRYTVLYRGKFRIGEEGAKGKEGNTSFQTKTLNATFAPLKFNGMWSYKVDSDSTDTPVDLDTTFFESVIMPTEKVVIP
ncbi:major tail protein [Proteiniborus sp. MB09-C3]|uniref:major tail protein n=1 Tax=Proteiniborus sp. MB09-C3 TaxID=3050072 RepID=UPI00255751D2|nr:major tail protein [Proteiniborus sp. MB09-C3]WIV10543.1 phage tail protein [Proteiniborus sp. MB09-C3]